jgi:type I restriction enzyme S subunit
MGRGFTVVHIYGSELKRLALAIPPPDEQATIVRFLDHADRRIRRYIRAKQKLIKLLEEQKQATIEQACTKGLNVEVHLKPSRITWLRCVPEHWQVFPLKRWVSTKITDGPHETPEWLDSGVPFLSAEAMVNGRLDFGRRRGFISKELHEAYCKKCRPQRDDIFMCKSGATTGKVAIVETDDEFSVWSPLALVRVNPQRVLPRFLFAVLKCEYVQRQVQDTWSYGTQPNLSMGAMERLMVALPPVLEQVSLLAHMDAATSVLTAAIKRSQQEVDLIREYRTRLITDVVTGKLDVREAAADLPDNAGDIAPSDEPGAEGEGDESAEQGEPVAEEAGA